VIWVDYCCMLLCSDGSSSLLSSVHLTAQYCIYCTCSCFCAVNKQLCLFTACVMLLNVLSHDCAITLCIKSIWMSISLLFISHVNVYELLEYRHYCIMTLQDTVQCSAVQCSAVQCMPLELCSKHLEAQEFNLLWLVMINFFRHKIL